MKPSVTKRNNFYPYFLLFFQPIFMASNIIVARGGVEYVPPVSLAFWRWLTVFLILIPFFFNEIIIKKKKFKKTQARILKDTMLRSKTDNCPCNARWYIYIYVEWRLYKPLTIPLHSFFQVMLKQLSHFRLFFLQIVLNKKQ